MRRLLGTLSLVALTACGGNALAESHPPHPTAPIPGTTADPALAVATWNAVRDYALALEVQAVADYTVARTQADVASYVAAVHQAEVAAAASIRRAPRVNSSPAPTGGGGSSGGGACGGAGYADRFIQRESGGDPTIANGGGHAANPFDAGRAWGCYQIIPSTWASACPEITTYDVASQARCAAKLPPSAWASSGPTG